MEQQTGKTVRDKVITKIEVAPDLELHVKITKADGLELLNIRNYVPSLKQYGRGVTLESRHLRALLGGLQQAKTVTNGSR